MAKQLAFYVNMNNCTGCKACQVACKDKNNLPTGIRWRRVFQYEGGEWINQGGEMVPSNVYAYAVSAACMHCQTRYVCKSARRLPSRSVRTGLCLSIRISALAAVIVPGPAHTARRSSTNRSA